MKGEGGRCKDERNKSDRWYKKRDWKDRVRPKENGERRRWPNYNCPQCEPSLFEEYENCKETRKARPAMMCETHSSRGEQIERALFLKSLSHIHIYVAFKCTRGKKIVGCSYDVSFKGSSCLLKAWKLLCKCSILFSVLLLKKLLPRCIDRSNVPLSKFMFCLDKRFENEQWFMWLSYYTAPLRSPNSCCCYLENWESRFYNRYSLYL